jgi:hypothetical protein
MTELLDRMPRCESCHQIVVPEKAFKVGGKKFQLTDKLANRYTLNTGSNARRFELEEVVEAP